MVQNANIGQNQRRTIAEAISVGILDNGAPNIVDVENTEEALLEGNEDLVGQDGLGPQASLDNGLLLQTNTTN